MSNGKNEAHPSQSLKFVPTMANLADCSKKLPDASEAKEQTVDVNVDGKSGIALTFEKITYTGRSGVPESRWSYKGRVLL